MKNDKWSHNLVTEMKTIAEAHPIAYCAIYLDAYKDGMRIGKRNTLMWCSIAIIGLCVAGVSYLQFKEQLEREGES